MSKKLADRLLTRAARKFMRAARKLVLCSFAMAAFGATATIDPGLFLDDVKFLASKNLKGRGTGTPELEKAAAFIAGKFRSFGLQPIDGKSYYQAFDVTTNAKLGADNRFGYTADGRHVSLAFPDDFIPFNFSAREKMSGGIVFAGYGITAPEYNYDDYKGIDVHGKIVLIMRHEPQEFDEKSIFAGKVYTQHAQFWSKASNAKMHGARGVVLINDGAAHPGEADDLEKFAEAAGPGDAGVPFVQIRYEIAERWFAIVGKSAGEIQKGIDQDLQPRSFAFPDGLQVDANLDVERVVKTVHNVAGYLPGTTDEYVAIGAHYDHLGLGEQFSLAPSLAGTIHPGADDNASGTAGVIELARWFSTQPKQKRGILFLTFAGEELGLLGSSYFVNHPLLPLDKDVTMINMDMIGRVRDGKVFIGGVGTGTTLKKLLEEITPKYGLHIDYSEAGYGSSDHTSFTTKQVPVLFFFSGLHADYHKPSDTWDKIDAPDAAKLLQLVAEVGEDLREAPDRPLFVRVKEPEHSGDVAGSGSGSGHSGYGPDFGSIPDFGEGVKGVKFADIREGSPAAKAGLKAGDVLVEFDGKPIQNLYDFTYALRAKKPGDEVIVKVMRGSEMVEVKVLLTKRK
ncbi:MAG TPA: M28 family peptidase [Bryobacteraceae bacterium]|nr:M28 family peptidase [Bryobacteraceae bacterium]